MAIADFDGDGRLDLALNNNDAPASLYLNRLPEAGPWVGLRLEGVESSRDAVGARVRFRVGDRWLLRTVEAGSGFASQAPLALHVGLGSAARVQTLEVSWPSGRVDTFDESELERAFDCELQLVEGSELAGCQPPPLLTSEVASPAGALVTPNGQV